MDIWGGKDIRKSWCLSIFLWMRNQPSQWNTLWCITRWDSLWGGSYRRRIGFLWLLGHPKIYSSQGACNLPCKKDNIGGAARREKWYTWAVNYIVCCVQSFQSPAGLHAYHASLNELLFPAATCPFHLQTHIHTWLGWTQLAGRPRFSTRTQPSPALSTQSIYRRTHTLTLHVHRLYTYTIPSKMEFTIRIALLTHFAPIKPKQKNKRENQQK